MVTSVNLVKSPPIALKAVGRLSRSLPYFRGKWRLIDYIFRNFQRGSNYAEFVRVGQSVGMMCRLDDEVQNNVWWLGMFEIAARNLLQRLKPGDVMFDVGANVGFYTVLASERVGRSGQVHSFEPQQAIFEELNANIARNKLQNVVVSRAIVSEEAGTQRIFHGYANNSGAASVLPPEDKARPFEDVTSVSIDEYCRAAPVTRIDVFKIDVEGHEMSVLRGARESLLAFKPYLFIEIVDERLRLAGSSSAEVFAFLSDLGYRAYAIGADGAELPLEQPQDGPLILFDPRRG